MSQMDMLASAAEDADVSRPGSRPLGRNATKAKKGKGKEAPSSPTHTALGDSLRIIEQERSAQLLAHESLMREFRLLQDKDTSNMKPMDLATHRLFL